MQTDPSREIGTTFGRSWQLLSSNWIIIVPAIIVGVIAGLISGVFTPQAYTDPVTGFPVVRSMLGLSWPLGIAIGTFVGYVGTIVTLMITTGMAASAWDRGSTTIADGMETLKRPNVTSATLALVVVSLILAALTFVTLGLGAILAAVVSFFLIYTMSASVVGGFGSTDALKESYEVARRSWLTTLIVIILLCVVAFVVGLIAAALHFIPLLGPAVGFALNSVVVAYFSLVLVGEYRALRAGGSAPVSAPPPSTPTY